MPRSSKPTGKTRHDPLHVQLREDEVHEKYGNVSRPGKRRKSRKAAEEEESGEVRACYVPFICIDANGNMLSNIGHPRPEDVAAYL